MDLCYLVELLDDREDEQGCEETDAHQRTPDDGEIHAPHVARDADQLVANGSCHEPSAHHHALVLHRRHLRDKCNADG